MNGGAWDSQWLHIMIQFNDLLLLMFSSISKFFAVALLFVVARLPLSVKPHHRWSTVVGRRHLRRRMNATKSRFYLLTVDCKPFLDFIFIRARHTACKKRESNRKKRSKHRQRHKIAVIWQIHKFKASHLLCWLLLNVNDHLSLSVVLCVCVFLLLFLRLLLLLLRRSNMPKTHQIHIWRTQYANSRASALL